MKFDQKNVFLTLFFAFFGSTVLANSGRYHSSSLGEAEFSHQSHQGFNLGVLAGSATMVDFQHSDHAPHGTAVAYKTAASYLFQNHFEIGAEFGMTGPYPTLGFDLNYYFQNHIFLGIEFAVKKNKKLYEYVGPKIGYDYYFSNRVSIGPEAFFLFPMDGKIGILEALFSVKYYF